MYKSRFIQETPRDQDTLPLDGELEKPDDKMMSTDKPQNDSESSSSSESDDEEVIKHEVEEAKVNGIKSTSSSSQDTGKILINILVHET